MKYLIDSNIIIYHLNGHELATNFLRQYAKDCAISHITYLEVMSFGYTPAQEGLVILFLDQFVLLDVTKVITMTCIKNRKIKKIKVPDNIIVSTAQVHGLTLVTHNVSDFVRLDVKLFDLMGGQVS